jgi:hypothetical protein
MQLAWADQVRRRTGKPVLILTPLAVASQTVREGEKFGIACRRSVAGELFSDIVVTNYERLHMFDVNDFGGVVCDESSILKAFNGTRRREITWFMRKLPYRLLCTATAAPNDYIELGTSSEALGNLGYADMMSRFFKSDQNTIDTRTKWATHGGQQPKWRLKGHAEIPFWQWVCTWARAARKPSDLGFDDSQFALPDLIEREHVVSASTLPDGMLFAVPARGLKEQRDERRRTLTERCEAIGAITDHRDPAIVWCHMNDESARLRSVITDCVEVSGADSDDAKEEKFSAFLSGEARVLVTKPKIGAWGLNFQHCAHVTFFPSHSYEQYYQGVRRCWRFGQTRPVVVDVVATEGEQGVMANLQRKSVAADQMFANLVRHMAGAKAINKNDHSTLVEVPSWL